MTLNPQVWWFSARAAGITAWALVSASVLWGLLVSTRAALRPGPAWNLDLHRFLGALSMVFVGFHLGALVADNYVHFGWAEILVPFASRWKSGAVAWGIVALYLLMLVEATSLMMRRLPRRLWRTVHLASFPIFVVSTIHVFAAGTDARNPALQVAALVACAGALFLTLFRVLAPRRVNRARGRRRGTLKPVEQAA